MRIAYTNEIDSATAPTALTADLQYLALMQVKFRTFDSLDELKTTYRQCFEIMSH